MSGFFFVDREELAHSFCSCEPKFDIRNTDKIIKLRRDIECPVHSVYFISPLAGYLAQIGDA